MSLSADPAALSQLATALRNLGDETEHDAAGVCGLGGGDPAFGAASASVQAWARWLGAGVLDATHAVAWLADRVDTAAAEYVAVDTSAVPATR